VCTTASRRRDSQAAANSASERGSALSWCAALLKIGSPMLALLSHWQALLLPAGLGGHQQQQQQYPGDGGC